MQDLRGYDYEHHTRIEAIELKHRAGELPIALGSLHRDRCSSALLCAHNMYNICIATCLSCHFTLHIIQRQPCYIHQLCYIYISRCLITYPMLPSLSIGPFHTLLAIPHNPVTSVRTRLTQSLSGLAWVGNYPRASALFSLFLLLLASETTSSKPHPAVAKRAWLAHWGGVRPWYVSGLVI